MPTPRSSTRKPGRNAAARSNRPARPSRPNFPARPNVSVRRRKPEPKGAEKFLAMLGGTAGKAKGAAPSSAKGKGGLALLVAGAGAALSQRERLTGLLRKDRSDDASVPPAPVPPAPPHTPAV